MDISEIARRYSKPTEDQQQELANASRLLLHLINEGHLAIVYASGHGINPKYVRERLNELEAALAPFPDGCCISDIPDKVVSHSPAITRGISENGIG